MKIKSILAAAGLGSFSLLGAAPLSQSTAVQSQPDASSPVIAVLKAGSEQPVASYTAGPSPAGWMAVEVPGPFQGYVKNRDLDKQLDVIPGASVYLAPKDGAGVLAVFQKGDKAEITGLHGGWTQVSLEKTLVGYIPTGSVAAAAAPSAPAAPVAAPIAATSAALPAPAAPAAAPSGTNDTTTLSRLFEGTLTTTKTLLGPRRPFDWQLVDASGKRVAYVDLSKLLLTDQIENYAGHAVVVLGSLESVKDSPEIVVNVDALRLK